MECAEHARLPTEKAVETLAREIKRMGAVFIIGNGGSFANAQHIANDLLSAGVRAFTMDASTMTAFANDHGYVEAFARWVDVIGGRKDEMLIALSGSGASDNIWVAIQSARSKKMMTVAVFGDFCHEEPVDFAPDLTVREGKNMQAAEEYQIRLGHAIMKKLCG